MTSHYTFQTQIRALFYVQQLNCYAICQQHYCIITFMFFQLVFQYLHFNLAIMLWHTFLVAFSHSMVHYISVVHLG